LTASLADTDALHLEAFNKVLRSSWPCLRSRTLHEKSFKGFSNASISERFLADEPPKRQSAIIGVKEEAFRKLVSGQIQTVAGLNEAAWP